MVSEQKGTFALLLASFFARSLTLVPHPLLLVNRTETLATQASTTSKVMPATHIISTTLQRSVVTLCIRNKWHFPIRKRLNMTR